LGAACVRGLVAEGATGVVIGDINEAGGAALVDELRSLGCAASYVATDVSDPVQCRALVDAAVEQLGHIDILVGAAGISHAGYQPDADVPYGSGPSRAPLVDVDLADWHRVINVNLHGLMYVNQAVARHMLAAGIKGSIVNITSMNSQRAAPGIAQYSVSKAAAWMMTKTLALELAEFGIRVNAVGPGFIDTPMNARLKADPDALARIISNTPLRRLGDPVDIANAVVYLASDDAAFVTGTLLCPDGGFISATR
jgi:NAD(P)-dependent dehydrogenase (short-subunit alcohol dehydrogenase family)